MPSTYGGAVKYTSGVSVRGFTQLQRALSRVDDGAAKELRARLKDIGGQVALVAAGNAPRDTGVLQHSIKTSVTLRGASVYSNVVYGGAINYGAFPKAGPQARGPHIKRANASHYMDRAVIETKPYVETEVTRLLDWLTTTFEED